MAKSSRKTRNRSTVCLAYLHAGNLSAYFAQSLFALLLHDQNGPRRVTGMLQEWSSANISAARNSLTTHFLDKQTADWLLWIDSDMSFEHNAVDMLLRAGDAVDRPIVGGLCFGASGDKLFPTIYHLGHDAQGHMTTIRVDDYPRDQLVEVDATGAAFLMIHRTVLEKMRAEQFNVTFPFFQETELNGQPAGEDLTFCLRSRLLGFPIFVDTRVKVGHHKHQLLTEQLFDSQKAG